MPVSPERRSDESPGEPLPEVFEELLRRHARFLESGQPLLPDVSFVELGLDSLGLLALLLSVEEAFAVVVPDEFLDPEVLATPRTMWQHLGRLVGEIS